MLGTIVINSNAAFAVIAPPVPYYCASRLIFIIVCIKAKCSCKMVNENIEQIAPCKYWFRRLMHLQRRIILLCWPYGSYKIFRIMSKYIETFYESCVKSNTTSRIQASVVVLRNSKLTYVDDRGHKKYGIGWT